MAVKKDYQKDLVKNDFSENEVKEVKMESKVEDIKKYVVAEPLKKMKYAIEAKEDIFCDKDKVVSTLLHVYKVLCRLLSTKYAQYFRVFVLIAAFYNIDFHSFSPA